MGLIDRVKNKIDILPYVTDPAFCLQPFTRAGYVFDSNLKRNYRVFSCTSPFTDPSQIKESFQSPEFLVLTRNARNKTQKHEK